MMFTNALFYSPIDFIMLRTLWKSVESLQSSKEEETRSKQLFLLSLQQ